MWWVLPQSRDCWKSLLHTPYYTGEMGTELKFLLVGGE